MLNRLISERNLQTIHAAQERGVQVVTVTGRPFFNARAITRSSIRLNMFTYKAL